MARRSGSQVGTAQWQRLQVDHSRLPVCVVFADIAGVAVAALLTALTPFKPYLANKDSLSDWGSHEVTVLSMQPHIANMLLQLSGAVLQLSSHWEMTNQAMYVGCVDHIAVDAETHWVLLLLLLVLLLLFLLLQFCCRPRRRRLPAW